MAGKASSLFARIPSEEALVADVYKKLDDSGINSFQDQLKTSFDLAEQFSFLSKASSGNLLKLAKDGMLQLNPESLKDKIAGAFSDDYTKAKSLVQGAIAGGKSAMATISSATTSVTGLLKQANNVYTTVNGVVNAVKHGNVSDLRGIVNTINLVSNKAGIALSANGALGDIMTGLVGEAGALGIRDSFGVVAAGIKDMTDVHNKSQVLYQMATGSLPGALARGDLGSVASIVDHLGKGAAGMMNPSTVSQLARNDQGTGIPKTTSTPATDVSRYIDYNAAYNRIYANWKKSDWQPVPTASPTTRLLFGEPEIEVLDMTPLLEASPHVKDVFTKGALASTDPKDKIYSIIDLFGAPRTVDQEIGLRYPFSPAASSTNIQKRDEDARTVSHQELIRMY